MASSGDVSLKGIGSRTVDKVFAHDIEWLKGSKPDILILELGTNNLSCLPPKVIGSRIHDLACFLWNEVRISIVGVCQVVDRNIPGLSNPDIAFRAKADKLLQFLSVVLVDEKGIFVWQHREFLKSRWRLLCSDGVHCNLAGQYRLYHSIVYIIASQLPLLPAY